MNAPVARPPAKPLEAWLTGLSASPSVTRTLVVEVDAEAPVVDAAALLPGGVRYTPGQEVGRGGMGSVVVAQDNLLGRPVAMKRLINPRPRPDELARFLREAQITGQLDHPNIVDVHDVGTDADGHPYFTMQYVRGNETLRSVIDELLAGNPDYHAHYTFERRVQIMQGVAQAVAFAHQRGVIHRDIKPDNIMVGPFGEVLLLDWGLAHLSAEEANAPPDLGPVRPVTDAGVTDPDTILGTPFYMAPEQLTDRAQPASDVYSLGAVLQELLSLHHYLGDPSFQLTELAQQIVRQPAEAADEHLDPLNGRVPPALAAICRRALHKDPADRQASAAELADELQAWLEGKSTVTCPHSAAVRALNGWRRTLERHPQAAFWISLALLAAFALSLALSAGFCWRALVS